MWIIRRASREIRMVSRHNRYTKNSKAKRVSADNDYKSGINRGLYTYKNFIDLSFYIHNELWNNELEIEINFCRHAPEECKCRKPKTGMLDRYNIEIETFLLEIKTLT